MRKSIGMLPVFIVSLFSAAAPAFATPITLSGSGVYDAVDPTITVRTRRDLTNPSGHESDSLLSFSASMQVSGNLLWDAYVVVQQLNPVVPDTPLIFDLAETIDPSLPGRYSLTGSAAGLLDNTDYAAHLLFAYQGEGAFDPVDSAFFDSYSFRITNVAFATSPGPVAAADLTDPVVVGNPTAVPEPAAVGLLGLALLGIALSRKAFGRSLSFASVN